MKLAGDPKRVLSATDWQSYDVVEMWRMLEHQETEQHNRHLSGWRRTVELTDAHLSKLRTYREELAQAWPPEHNAAAKAYLDRLDFLIETVRQTHDTAVTNYGTLSPAITAVVRSRMDLKKIYDEYVSKQQAKQEYEERLAINQASQLPGAGQATPPVTDADLERLNARARGIMIGLSGELTQAQTQLRQPPTYKPGAGYEPTKSEVTGTSSPPPILPPIVAVTDTAPPRTTPPGPTQVVPVAPAPAAGPILAGAGPTPTAPTISPLSPSVITPTPSPSPGIGFLPGLPGNPGKLPGLGTTTPFGPGGNTLAKPGVAGMPRAMPPGGMIGGAPGAGLGQPGTGARAARRINPVGGVIGEDGAGNHPDVGTGRGAGRGKDPRWDPDNPWEADEGVPPVVLPPREIDQIDPGPAIGREQ